MKGVILGIAPEAQLVDISHQIPPQDVLAAAFVLRHAAREFPPGTVHLAVVDPGVGTRRRHLALQSSGHLWVGPDNGLFSFVLDCADGRVHEIARPDLARPNPSSTFHGRDLFAPLAAHLCRGLDLADIGPPVADPVRLAESAPCKSATASPVHIIYIDGFGNLVSNIEAADIAPWGAALRIRVGDYVITELCRTYEDVESGAPLALIGSAGLLEVRSTAAMPPANWGCNTALLLSSKSFEKEERCLVLHSSSAFLEFAASLAQSLTDEVVARFASAFGTTLTPGDTVVLARDTRPSGVAFAQAAAAALCQTGLPRRRCGYVFHARSQADDL